jgi:hypothetical protein
MGTMNDCGSPLVNLLLLVHFFLKKLEPNFVDMWR